MTNLLLALASVLLSFPAIASSVISIDGSGRIEKPGKCSPKIGSGANYIQGSVRLAGKCENGGNRPRIEKEPNGNKYLNFSTSPAKLQSNTRTELAYTPYFPFNKETTIRFRIRIPEGAPRQNPGKMFYAMQLWQCSPLSPIAGIRLVPGTSHTIDFPVRLQNSSTPVIARFNLKPGQWHSIKLKATPSLNPSIGSMKVSVDGKALANWKGAYGSTPSRCKSPSNSNGYRVKFGIYRSSDSPSYSIDFDDLSIDLK